MGSCGLDGLPHDGQDEDVLKIELSEAGCEEADFLTAAQRSLDNDTPLATDDAEPAFSREILSCNRGIRHRDSKLLGQGFQG